MSQSELGTAFGGVLGEGYTRDAVRAMVRTIASSETYRTVSAGEFQRTLQDLGIGYRRTDLLSDIRTARDQAIRAERIANVGRDRAPTLAVFEDGPATMRGNYRFVARIVGSDIDGSTYQDYVTFESDSLMTIGEYESNIQDFFESQYQGLFATVEDVSIRRGYISPRIR